jgi:hypothetical protein
VCEFTTSFTAVSGHRLHPTTRVDDDTFADVARGVAAYDPSITGLDAAFFAGAAIAAYCPQYKYLVNDGT